MDGERKEYRRAGKPEYDGSSKAEVKNGRQRYLAHIILSGSILYRESPKKLNKFAYAGSLPDSSCCLIRGLI